MKKKIVLLITIILTLGTTAFAGDSTNRTFTDFDSSHWAYSAVNQMVKDGVVNGYSDNTFRPEQKITRAEFAKIFSVALDVNFEDENIGVRNVIDGVDSSHWAYQYIESAYPYFPSKEYFKAPFEPDKYITREDAAFIISARLLPNVSTDGVLNSFSDANEISSNKREYVSLAIASGIMNGHGNGKLDPKGNLTRAEVCTLFNNVKYKSNLYKEYLKFGEILKCVTITSNLNGDEKNKVDVELIFDLPSIKSADVQVLMLEKNGEEDISFGKTKNEKYKNMENIKISFYAEPEEFYSIGVYNLTTLDGKRTHGTTMLSINEPGRLDIKYDGEINKDTKFEFEWDTTSFEIPSKSIEWHLIDKNVSGEIKNGEFSVEEDIIKVSEKALGKNLNVMFAAEDDKYYGDFQRIYRYNIFNISNSKTSN